MKLGDIFASRETIGRLYSVRLKNGAAAFRLRREVKKLNEELLTFTKLRDEKIKEYGVKEIKPGDEHFDDVAKWVNEAFQQEVPIEIKAAISEKDLGDIPISLHDIDVLVKLGLLADG